MGEPLKLTPMSDLHFGAPTAWRPRLRADVDLLVVAGDVYEGDIVRSIAWTAEVADGRPSVFVPGNHEFWGRALEAELDRGREAAASLGVSMLDGQGWVEVGGVDFVGGTLWTDLSLNVVADRPIFGRQLGEPVDVRGAGIDRRAKPGDAVRWHRRIAGAIETALAEAPRGRPRVVVTHHAPTALSLLERYRRDPSAAFAASALDRLLAGGADVWIHGHVHHSVDLVVGGTRLVCNPFGYDGANPDFTEDLVLELPDPPQDAPVASVP
ncbi:3',5'-cyclic adenosine monophosphate phosphodiesterase CpdA [Methylobacterium hispanicum]|uniref:3',5'-cyclic adenosine monophosphate phosphodiesterase CpdA n=1 Tax=Methylobacterium hispanicum TaxID=270350 RepID=A0AAV4ZUE8_9HYPH|nr:metallophosphoesterase [Methylobacterium hispanicum]GJD91615.1 3',5'-cyclic adenosine monophosphate phosphodiesterase CpdA [Methylobacterium hispanicum]